LRELLKRLRAAPVIKNQNLAICCIVKDENAYLAEWVDYHLKIGVEHFYIYDNGSKFSIAETLNQLGATSISTVTRISGKAKQVKAYGHCLKKWGKYSKWIAFIDTDEFIVPKSSQGDLPLFLSDYESFGGLGINWQVFGSNGHLKRTHESQLTSFTMRATEGFHVNKHIKCIVQPQYVRAVANSHSFLFKEDKFCVNENFERLTGEFSEVSVKKIQLNHYYCRSLEEYQDKIKRGLGDTGRKRSIDEFYQHDKESNEVSDTTILSFLNKTALR